MSRKRSESSLDNSVEGEDWVTRCGVALLGFRSAPTRVDRVLYDGWLLSGRPGPACDRPAPWPTGFRSGCGLQ